MKNHTQKEIINERFDQMLARANKGEYARPATNQKTPSLDALDLSSHLRVVKDMINKALDQNAVKKGKADKYVHSKLNPLQEELRVLRHSKKQVQEENERLKGERQYLQGRVAKLELQVKLTEGAQL